MSINFASRLEAIEWIANYVEDEGQFEVLREQLNFNYCYYERFFLAINEPIAEVVMLDQKANNRDH
jgi:hypothetical protein